MREFMMIARIVGGRLQDGARLDAAMQRFRDGEVVVTVERRHATRSVEQNAAYWVAIVNPLAEHTGYTPDEIHEILKAKFLPKRVAIQDGNGEIVDEYVIGGTTTRLDKVQFGEFIREIQVWAAETLGLDLQIESRGEAA